MLAHLKKRAQFAVGGQSPLNGGAAVALPNVNYTPKKSSTFLVNKARTGQLIGGK